MHIPLCALCVRLHTNTAPESEAIQILVAALSVPPILSKFFEYLLEQFGRDWSEVSNRLYQIKYKMFVEALLYSAEIAIAGKC